MMIYDGYILDRFAGMNTEIEILLESDKKGVHWFQEARSWFAFVEETFSRFRPESELSRVNRSKGKPVLISSAMFEVLTLAEQYRRITDGMFEPFILAALEKAGYKESFEQIPGIALVSIADAESPPTGRPRPLFQFNRGMNAVTIPSGGRLDLGGIVKGWSADWISATYRKQDIRSGMVSAGGDIVVWGGTDNNPWVVEIADPWDVNQTIKNIHLLNGGVATSNTIGRSWRYGSGNAHHLINPRTMLPAVSDIVQCTVIGDTACDCDVYAKVVCVLGSKEGASWLNRVAPTYQAIMVTGEGHIRYAGTCKERRD